MSKIQTTTVEEAERLAALLDYIRNGDDEPDDDIENNDGQQ